MTKEGIWMAEQHTKRRSVSLASRDVRVTITVGVTVHVLEQLSIFLVTALSADKTPK